MAVQISTRVDEKIRDKASKIAQYHGFTLPDLMRIVITKVANEGIIPISFDRAISISEFDEKNPEIQSFIDEVNQEVLNA